MSTCDISKYESSISIFEHFMTKFHELPEQPSYYIQVCNTTHDFSQQNMFVFYIMFSWIVRHETLYSPFKIISLISRPDNKAYWQNWEPSTPKNSKHVCSASESSSYEDYMAIYVLSTICKPYHFVGFQIDFEGYWKVLNRW